MSARKSIKTKVAGSRVRAVTPSILPLAGRGVRKARAWAAPNVERTGQVLQEAVAPKVSAALSAAARQIDPATPRHRRWRKQASIAALAAVLGGAVAGLGRRARNTEASTVPADGASADQPADEAAVPADKA